MGAPNFFKLPVREVAAFGGRFDPIGVIGRQGRATDCDEGNGGDRGECQGTGRDFHSLGAPYFRTAKRMENERMQAATQTTVHIP